MAQQNQGHHLAGGNLTADKKQAKHYGKAAIAQKNNALFQMYTQISINPKPTVYQKMKIKVKKSSIIAKNFF